MAGPAILLETDTTGKGIFSWQLAKSPTAAQTALTAANLTVDLRDIIVSNELLAPEYFDVSAFDSIAVQVWGEAADTNSFTLDIYGWSDNGPGRHLQSMETCLFGNFTSPANTGWHASNFSHPSVRKKFLKDKTYRSADTYVLTAGKDYSVKLMATSPAVQIPTNFEADFPTEFVIDLYTTRFKYLSIMATAMTATSVGAVFKPLCMRK